MPIPKPTTVTGRWIAAVDAILGEVGLRGSIPIYSYDQGAQVRHVPLPGRPVPERLAVTGKECVSQVFPTVTVTAQFGGDGEFLWNIIDCRAADTVDRDEFYASPYMSGRGRVPMDQLVYQLHQTLRERRRVVLAVRNRWKSPPIGFQSGRGRHSPHVLWRWPERSPYDA